MTNEEKIAAWKSMTSEELWRKYTPKMLSREITPAQYQTILSYAKDKEPIPSHDQDQTGEAVGVVAPVEPTERSFGQTLCEQFGGYIVPDSEEEHKAQWKKLLDLLMDMAWHDTGEITDKVYSVGHKGVCRISERIRDIEKYTEWKTESRHKSGPTWEYRIINNNKLI